MSLELKIEALTVAIIALTAAMGNGASVAADKADAGEKPASTKGTGKGAVKYTPQHTIEEMQALLGELRDKSDAATAKAIIKSVGKADKMNEITDPKTVDAVYEAAKTKLEEIGGDGDDM